MTKAELAKASLGRSEQRCRDAFDNAAAESFWARIRTELVDTRKWTTGVELAAAVLGWVEAFYNRTRRHSALDISSRARTLDVASPVAR